MTTLRMIYLKTKRRKLINGLAWLQESQPDNPKITEMTNDLQEVNAQIDTLNDEKNTSEEDK